MKNGFTFVEMAIVLMLIAILSGLGTMKIVQSMSQGRMNSIERDTLAKISAAVIQATTSSINKNLPNDDAFRNIATQYMRERQIIYRGITSSICSTTSTTRKVELCRNSDCSEFDNITDIAFIIFSSGINGAIDINTDGDVIRVPSSGQVDDNVKYVTLSEMKVNVGCGGPLRVVNDALPKMTSDGKNLQDNLTIIAENGVPTGENRLYWWCLEMARVDEFFSSQWTVKTKLYANAATELPGKCTNDLFLNFNKAEIQPVLDYQYIKLPSGNYPLTVVVKDTVNTLVKQDTILTITDLVHMPDHNEQERVAKKYGCITVQDNSTANVIICRQSFSDTAKVFCKVTDISESAILGATGCKSRIEDLYTPKTGTK